MKRILVTGASGMVGTAVCRRLSAEGIDFVTAGRSQLDHVAWQAGQSLRHAMVDVDAVVHLAARVHVRGRGYADRSAFDAVNVDATAQLADDAAASGVGRLVFVSSIGVLGGASPEPLNESMPANPHTPYALSKWRAECALHERSDIESVVLRPPAIIGKNARGNLHSIVAAIRRGLPLPFRAISNRRQFVTVENLVDAIMLALQSQATGGKTFHVANPEVISTPELCEAVGEVLGRRPRLISFPPKLLHGGLALLGRQSLAQGLMEDLLIDTQALQAQGWRPRESLRDGIHGALEEVS